MVHNNTQMDSVYDSSEYVMGVELEKAYEISSAVIERILWECDGKFNTPGLNLTEPFKNKNPFAAGLTLAEIVRKHLNSYPSAFYDNSFPGKQSSVPVSILKENQLITGKTYNPTNIIDSYCECARDTCLVRAKSAVIWLHQNSYPHRNDCGILTKDNVEKIINQSMTESQPKNGPSYNKKAEADKWEKLAQDLTGAEKRTAVCAKAKWLGKTHAAVYAIVFPNKTVTKSTTPKSYVTKAKAEAEKLIQAHLDCQLIMPPWNSTE